MSATGTSPSSAPGERDGHSIREETINSTELSERQHDTAIEGQPQSSMIAEADKGSQMQNDSIPLASDFSTSAPLPAATPSQSDPLAGHMETLAMSERSEPDAEPSSPANNPPPPPEKDEPYLNPNSNIPGLAPHTPSETTSAPGSEKELPDVPGDSDPELRQGGLSDDVREDNDSQPEIQNIMGQFQDPARTPGQEEIMSPRMELAEQFRGAQSYFPPRKSSLDHLQPTLSTSSTAGPSGSQSSQTSQYSHKSVGHDEPALTRRSSTSTVPPPPEPEPDQPFDFHRFLEQLRHRTADPVAKFLRSFLMEFGKRQWMVHEQVKIISDFLAFITNKMAMCEVWRDVSDSEFDNAKEGMEKLVMNRLYSQTFAPAIPAPPTIPRSASRSRRREIERLHGPWRRGQHQEDIERDDILAQKIRIYGWIKEEHLDIAPVSGGGRRFLNLAQQGMSPDINLDHH